MSSTQMTRKQEQIQIEPYVTISGNIIILNGSFPIDTAKKMLDMCAAAPALKNVLNASKDILPLLCSGLNSIKPWQKEVDVLVSAIEEAESKIDKR